MNKAERDRAWRLANPEKVKAQQARYRARRKSTGAQKPVVKKDGPEAEKRRLAKNERARRAYAKSRNITPEQIAARNAERNISYEERMARRKAKQAEYSREYHRKRKDDPEYRAKMAAKTRARYLKIASGEHVQTRPRYATEEERAEARRLARRKSCAKKRGTSRLVLQSCLNGEIGEERQQRVAVLGIGGNRHHEILMRRLDAFDEEVEDDVVRRGLIHTAHDSAPCAARICSIAVFIQFRI